MANTADVQNACAGLVGDTRHSGHGDLSFCVGAGPRDTDNEPKVGGGHRSQQLGGHLRMAFTGALGRRGSPTPSMGLPLNEVVGDQVGPSA